MPLHRHHIACALIAGLVTAPSTGAQQTRAERTSFTETSSYADVIAFLDSLDLRAPRKLVRGSIGRSVEGRDIPFVVASRPAVATPEAARRTGRPIVYLQANIHAGEVEGKEAVQALLRDLVLDSRPNVLDSLVVVVVPIYNADGNEKWGPQERQRGAQNGPALVGQRPNADTLDLNRDYIKGEAPETRGSLAMFAAWRPDVFVDLHTTDGSYHGYALTYAPSLHPAAMEGALSPAGPWTRDTLLPELRRRVRQRDGFETFDYGNFRGVGDRRDDPTSLAKGGWETYEHGPRYGTNYAGLRGMVSILSEAYSHDPFARRVAATRAFVQELLSAVADHRTIVLARVRGARAAKVRTPVPIRAALTREPHTDSVLVEPLVATGDSVRHEPGLRPGYRRSGKVTAVAMPVFDRFDAVRGAPLPTAWVLDASASDLGAQLERHGLEVQRLQSAWRGAGATFVVDSMGRGAQAFQRHREVRLEGHWEVGVLDLPAGTIVVPADQRLAALAAVLLEPESDDGLTTWNAFDSALAKGAPHPVRRVTGSIPERSRKR